MNWQTFRATLIWDFRPKIPYETQCVAQRIKVRSRELYRVRTQIEDISDNMSEEMKTMPFGDVWNEFLDREGVTRNYLGEVKKYEAEVLAKR